MASSSLRASPYFLPAFSIGGDRAVTQEAIQGKTDMQEPSDCWKHGSAYQQKPLPCWNVCSAARFQASRLSLALSKLLLPKPDVGFLFGGATPQPKVYCWPYRRFVTTGVDMQDEWHSTISSPTSSASWCGLLRAGPIDISSPIVFREDSMGWISSTTLSIRRWKPKHPSCLISASMGKCWALMKNLQKNKGF